MRWTTIGAVAGLCVLAPAAASKLGLFGTPNTIEGKARRDEAFIVGPSEPGMVAAYQKGRATLDQFLVVNENRPPNSRAFAVKIPVRDDGKVEWFWIASFTRDGEAFRGKIDNTPRFVSNVRQGEMISFARADIVDWMYVRDGKMKGNYTACALLAKENKQAREDFMRKYGMDCTA